MLRSTEGQAGGRKETSTVDQPYLLTYYNRQIEERRNYITYSFRYRYLDVDIEKAYDKTWLNAVLCMVWKNKIRGKYLIAHKQKLGVKSKISCSPVQMMNKENQGCVLATHLPGLDSDNLVRVSPKWLYGCMKSEHFWLVN